MQFLHVLPNQNKVFRKKLCTQKTAQICLREWLGHEADRLKPRVKTAPLLQIHRPNLSASTIGNPSTPKSDPS